MIDLDTVFFREPQRTFGSQTITGLMFRTSEGDKKAFRAQYNEEKRMVYVTLLDGPALGEVLVIPVENVRQMRFKEQKTPGKLTPPPAPAVKGRPRAGAEVRESWGRDR